VTAAEVRRELAEEYTAIQRIIDAAWRDIARRLSVVAEHVRIHALDGHLMVEGALGHTDAARLLRAVAEYLQDEMVSVRRQGAVWIVYGWATVPGTTTRVRSLPLGDPAAAAYHEALRVSRLPAEAPRRNAKLEGARLRQRAAEASWERGAGGSKSWERSKGR